MLIRHGESQVMVDSVVGGHDSCSGLSDLGRRQAEALRDRLVRTGELRDATVLMASILPRAIETAEIIAPGVGDGTLKPVQECDLCEQHPGDADGLTWDEFERRYRPEGFVWDATTPFAPGAESWVEFTARVAAALRTVVEEHEDETIVIACHGGVITSALVEFLGLADHGTKVGSHSENTSLTEFTLGGDNWPARNEAWRFVRFNDSAHLADLD